MASRAIYLLTRLFRIQSTEFSCFFYHSILDQSNRSSLLNELGNVSPSYHAPGLASSESFSFTIHQSHNWYEVSAECRSFQSQDVEIFVHALILRILSFSLVACTINWRTAYFVRIWLLQCLVSLRVSCRCSRWLEVNWHIWGDCSTFQNL